MEIQLKLCMWILLSNIFCTYCCKPKQKASCPKYDNLSSCAKLYEDVNCRGRVYTVEEGVNPINKRRIMSFVVKKECIMTIYTPVYRYSWDVVGERPFIRYIRERGSKKPTIHSIAEPIAISNVACYCNKYKGCPNHKRLSPRTADEKSMCAIAYMYATDDPHTSCVGNSREIYNGEQEKQLSGEWDLHIQSVVVREGCIFKGYSQRIYRGRNKEFSGVNEQLTIDNVVGDVRSFICKCEFLPVDCTPSESWERLMVCSNPDNSKPTCEHWISQGVSVARITTTEHGVTQNIELTYGLELKKIFKLGLTSNTGYNWKTSKAFSTTESSETKTRVSFTIPVGETYALYQLVGQCGKIDVKTQYYKIRDESKEEVITQKEAN